MAFPLQALTEKYVSSSYQDVLQQYSSSSYLYVLDGLGNVVFNIPSASVGNTIITSDVTSSMVIGNFDGGTPDSNYGGIAIINGGNP